MKFYKTLMMFGLALALPALAKADVKSTIAVIEAGEKACLEHAMSTFDINNCQAASYRAADALLNQTYKAVVAKLKAQFPADKKAGLSASQSSQEVLKRLISSEVAWIKFRDTQCSFEGVQMLGGSGEGMIVGGCFNTMTKERIVTIDRLAGEGQMR